MARSEVWRLARQQCEAIEAPNGITLTTLGAAEARLRSPKRARELNLTMSCLESLKSFIEKSASSEDSDGSGEAG